jgi:hypothetical protein
MGFFSIKPQTVQEAARQVWLPDVDLMDTRVTGERSRVLNQPGFKNLVDEAIARGSTDLRVFQVGKDEKGPNGTVVEGRPGLLEARFTPQGERQVVAHLPVSRVIADQTSMEETVIPITELETGEIGSQADINKYAAGAAIFKYVNGIEQ